jgi:large subunit ribosomal protein L18
MTKNLFDRRKDRARYKISQAANGRPRLSVYRSGKHIYAQIIDDANGATLVTASTHEKGSTLSKTYNMAAAAEVGKKIAERAKGKGLSQVIFDRGGYIYHGRVKALAEAAREGGLEF